MEKHAMLLAMKVPLAIVTALASLPQGQTDDPKAFAYYQQALNDSNDSNTPNRELQRLWTYTGREGTGSPHGGGVFFDSGSGGSGVTLVPVDESTRAHLKLPKGQGLVATSVVANGPAAQAGIRENDILLTLGDAALGKPEDLEEQLKGAGDRPIALGLLHHGEKKTLQ